uniref:UDP-glucuronosyltransferase 2B28 n=1 Tax=Zeugodacus cucurbitae TaxID=28588 RepID=A0A0A1WG59_ZEUCU
MNVKSVAVFLILLVNILSVFGNVIPGAKPDNIQVQQLKRSQRDSFWHYSSEQEEHGDEKESLFETKSSVINGVSHFGTRNKSTHTTIKKYKHSSSDIKILNF